MSSSGSGWCVEVVLKKLLVGIALPHVILVCGFMCFPIVLHDLDIVRDHGASGVVMHKWHFGSHFLLK